MIDLVEGSQAPDLDRWLAEQAEEWTSAVAITVCNLHKPFRAALNQAAYQRGRDFPNDAAAARLVTAVVVEAHDEWAVNERRYLSEESMAKLYAEPTAESVTEEAPPGSSLPARSCGFGAAGACRR